MLPCLSSDDYQHILIIKFKKIWVEPTEISAYFSRLVIVFLFFPFSVSQEFGIHISEFTDERCKYHTLYIFSTHAESNQMNPRSRIHHDSKNLLFTFETDCRLNEKSETAKLGEM